MIPTQPPTRFIWRTPTEQISPTDRVSEQIPSNAAIGVDCAEIVNLLERSEKLPPNATYLAGFVLIESYIGINPAPLDVVATYTTATGAAAPVNFIEVVPITGTKLAAGTWPF